MDPDRDPFIENLRRELRKDPVGGDVDSRIMGAVRRTGMARWPRLFMPRRLFVTPLPWSLAVTVALIPHLGILGAAGLTFLATQLGGNDDPASP